MKLTTWGALTFATRISPDALIGSFAILAQTVVTADPWDRVFNYGMPFVILAGFAWITIKVLIPFAIKRIEKGDEDRRIERDKFLTAIDKLTDVMNETRKTLQESNASRDRVQQTSNEAIQNLSAAIHERFVSTRQRGSSDR